MKYIVTLLAMLALAVLPAKAQTNLPPIPTPNGVLQELQSYLVNNDQSYNGWLSNKFTLWEAAAFSSVKGVPGESSIGNDLGLEVPVHKYNLHLDSVTRFEQVFGDIAFQQVGIAYDYNLHQIQLSAGLDGRYMFAASRLQAVPFIEFKKASTSLLGTSPFIRYSLPVQSKPGAGEVDIGLSISF